MTRFASRPSLPPILLLGCCAGRSPEETAFFERLHLELQKVDAHYLDREKVFVGRYTDLIERFQRLQANPANTEDAVRSFLADLVRFYMDLILLENYAVMCYCGFGKILKKHDKVTGFATRRKFMVHMVNSKEFTHYPTLLAMTQFTEKTYQAVNKWAPDVALHDPTVPKQLAELQAMVAESQSTKVDVEAGHNDSDGMRGPTTAAAPAMGSARALYEHDAGPIVDTGGGAASSGMDADSGSGAGAGSGTSGGAHAGDGMYAGHGGHAASAGGAAPPPPSAYHLSSYTTGVRLPPAPVDHAETAGVVAAGAAAHGLPAHTPMTAPLTPGAVAAFTSGAPPPGAAMLYPGVATPALREALGTAAGAPAAGHGHAWHPAPDSSQGDSEMR